jgi:5-deoxy-glucuronate isomerase
MTSQLLIRHGSCRDAHDAVVITPEAAGWSYTGLRVIELTPRETRAWTSNDDEQLVLPLQGSCTVRADGREFTLEGRVNPFAGPSDCLYVPAGGRVELCSPKGGTFAIPSARATTEGAGIEYLPAATVPVEVRGAGSATRLLNNFFAPGRGAAQRLVAVEVITPAGNTSSYPPHKHDASVNGEAELEEIYYFRFQSPNAFGLHATYTADGSLDEAVRVRDGDVFLVPRGYHGPCVALPGYDMYYLNVLAGPRAERSLAFSDDPAYAWIRDSWKDQAIDPRVVSMSGGRRG